MIALRFSLQEGTQVKASRQEGLKSWGIPKAILISYALHPQMYIPNELHLFDPGTTE